MEAEITERAHHNLGNLFRAGRSLPTPVDHGALEYFDEGDREIVQRSPVFAFGPLVPQGSKFGDVDRCQRGHG